MEARGHLHLVIYAMKKILATILCAGAILAAAFAANETVTETLSVTTVRRTWRIHVFSDFGTDYRVEYLREELRKLPDNTVIGRNQTLPNVTRAISAVAAEQVTLTNGKAISGAELAEALSRFGDKWAAEDAAPPSPPTQ